jgi:hypothetical protein
LDPSSLTDEIIESLLRCEKIIKSKRAKETPKAKHKERNIDVISSDGLQDFTLITRQSTMIADNYSCGLLWHATATQKIILTRYNGSDHVHGNPIEGAEFGFECHIHVATERYIAIGKKIEHYAEQTSRYNTLDGAITCLMADCNISWTASHAGQEANQGNLF